MRLFLALMNGLLLIGYVWAEIQWPREFDGTIETTGTYTFDEGNSFNLDYYGQKSSVFHMVSKCTADVDEGGYLSVFMYNTRTSQPILFDEIECTEESSISYTNSNPYVFNEIYNIRVIGKPGYRFEIKVFSNMTDIEINDKGIGETLITVDRESHVIRSFYVSDEQINAIGTWSYVQVSAESNDTFAYDPDKNVMMDNSWTHGCGPGGSDDGERLVAKLIVTQTHEDLDNFFYNPDAAIEASMRLSFSCFGMITISNASLPALKRGQWVVGVTLDPGQNYTMQLKKNVKIRVTIETNHQYVERILIMLGVSLIGIVIPFIARVIFDAGNMDIFKQVQFKTWLSTLKDWAWRGNKGMSYLVALIAALLIVSAFQVVHARHYEMMRTGDRDLCYYNEKCYRPYGNHYDVSVNGLASNLPFMVHGVLLILYFSFAESYCKANGHEYYDYSLPYSFGFAFICEGFGSLIYHICPSQIIFQFDTLFMFVISLIMITAIYEGLAIRDKDVKYSRLANQKTLRPTKVFAFFVGPVYFFNFIGNLCSANQGLPTKVMIPFYVLFGLWWAGILCWLGYKHGLGPKCLDPKNLPEVEDKPGVDVDGVTRADFVEWMIKHNKVLKAVFFTLYCFVVIVGFVFAVLQKVAFSMFILGVLIIALVVMEVVHFMPVASLVVRHFHNLKVQVAKNCGTLSKHVLVLIGMIMFLLIGCVVIVVSLVFFVVFTTTDKSLDPWLSRESNNPCLLDSFYDSHDFWHLFASFGLMIMAMVVTTISKPCRDCYLVYMERTKEEISSDRATFGSVRTRPTSVSANQAVTATDM